MSEASVLTTTTPVVDLLLELATAAAAATTTTTPSSATTIPPKALYANSRRMIYSLLIMGLGVLGNSLALIILARKKHNKNSKYTLMLRCLATNNLVALLGMLTTALLKNSVSEEVHQSYMRLDCVCHVVWRFFGLSSGCIAAVMAAERWMALARPFIYHKHITYELVRKTVNIIIIVAFVVTCLPLLGFGAYIDVETNPNIPKCIRYRDASGAWNKAYAIFFMVFGTLLCIVIVACNLFVAHTLLFVIGKSRTAKRHMHYDIVGGRDKSIRIDPESSSGTTLYSAGSTYSHHSGTPSRQFHHSVSVTMSATDSSPVEIKFAKLMAFLSFSFVICWMPQMIAIPLAIKTDRVPASNAFFIIADVLTALHFTIDPYIYVVSRTKAINWSLLGCIKRWRYGWRSGGLRRSQSDQSRMRTTTTEANTLDCNYN
ncbi:prostaglandin D2 receptor [Drosophila willistoni]|uniref:prostaglandin D2 receptor n=1 Tax=Drosophila willistoni TaxID=7260 RepID=UPI00017D8004|nr:prostaglandin D2 receptor [Drosophila willistoni]